MHAAADFAQERDELEAVLSSGIFHRAPNLALVLTYVCQKYFEGEAEQIKEYNIAVEALGRPPEFDQKRDSIVRVEAHRLRKRLREYYESAGARHQVHIDIPSGQYAPRFVRQRIEETMEEDAPAGETAAAEAPRELEPAVISRGMPFARRAWSLSGILLTVAAIGATAAVMWRTPAHTNVRANAAPRRETAPPVVEGRSDEVRILAGQSMGPYTDRFGHTWESDRYYNGGSAFEAGSRLIAGARDPRLYLSRREGVFSYDIPLAPGSYEMRLHFAETLYGEGNMAGGGETSRIFNVVANGVYILEQFDIIGEVGASAADTRAFKDITPAADGKLHLKFEAVTNPAILSAIEITRGTPGRIQPIRMVSRDHPYTDRQGRTWEADRYSRGGQLVQRTDPIANVEDADLLSGERYGNLRYVIPVPKGRYGVTLYFAETWFGPGKFAGGGVGSRLFDILCNGVAIRRGFDVFKEAHGSDRAVTMRMHALEPDPQGKLTIALTPVRNYASVNAIEVIDESR